MGAERRRHARGADETGMQGTMLCRICAEMSLCCEATLPTYLPTLYGQAAVPNCAVSRQLQRHAMHSTGTRRIRTARSPPGRYDKDQVVEAAPSRGRIVRIRKVRRA
jgi:hypothetical protein